MVVSFGPYFVRKIPRALGVVEFEKDKFFGNLFLAKLKTAITFAPGIRMTIIIYEFGVGKNFPFCGNWLLNSKNQLFTKFFFIFQVLLSYFSKHCLSSFHS